MYSSDFLIDYHKRLWKFIKEHISDMRIYQAKEEFSKENLPTNTFIKCVGCIIGSAVSIAHKCDSCPFDDNICYDRFSDYAMLEGLNYKLLVVGDKSDKILPLAYELCDKIINAEFDEEIIKKYDVICEEVCL